MSWKRNITIIAVLLLATGIFFIIKQFLNRPKIEVNNNDLVFISDEDNIQIYKDIDSVKTLKEFDYKVLESFTKVLDKYNSTRKPDEAYMVSPEFMSDNPESITVITDNYKSDLLDGLQITSLTEKDLPALKKFTQIFFSEYSKYPLAWMRLATPPVIVFAKSLSLDEYKGEVIGGVETGAITYNISAVDDVSYTKHQIHHELMHWFDKRMSSGIDLWPEKNKSYAQAYDFKSLNNLDDHPSEGFVTIYAKTNKFEDKAEVYSYLFTKEGNSKLNEWVKTDKKLESKVNFIKNLIRSRVSKMDDEYFAEKVR